MRKELYLLHLVPAERDGLRRYRVILESVHGEHHRLHFASLKDLLDFLREREANLVNDLEMVELQE